MLYLVAVLAIGGQLGASAGASFSVAEHRLIEIKSTIETPTGHAVLLTNWTVAEGLDYRQQGETLIATGPPGEYVIRQQVVTAKVEGDVIKLPIQQHFAVYQLTITGRAPRPPPKPDDPDPTSAPFPSSGLAILILKEASETGTLSTAQRAIFTSPRILKFGQQYAVKVNGDAFFRIWDDDFSDADLANVSDHLRVAYRAVKPTSLPWIAISSGDRGYSGPLPGNIEDTLKLLERFK